MGTERLMNAKVGQIWFQSHSQTLLNDEQDLSCPEVNCNAQQRRTPRLLQLEIDQL